MALLAKLFSPPTLLGDSEAHLLEAISGEAGKFQHGGTARTMTWPPLFPLPGVRLLYKTGGTAR